MKHYPILFILLLSLLLYNQTYMPNALERTDNLAFNTDTGNNFNGTTAKYYGIQLGSFRLLLVVGSQNDNYSLHLVLFHKGVDMIIHKGDRRINIHSKILSILSYRGLILQSSIRKFIDLTKQNWDVKITQRIISRYYASIILVVTTLVKNGSLSIRYKFNFTRSESMASIPSYTIKDGKIVKDSAINRKGTNVTSSVKIDHIISGLDEYRAVILPFTQSIRYSVDVPKIIIPNRNFTARIIKNKVSFTNIHFKTFFSWAPEVEVDGKQKEISMGIFNFSRTSHIVRLNDSSLNAVFKLKSINFFRYPTGEMILHDPFLGAHTFLETIQRIVIYPKIQFIGEIVGLIIVTLSVFKRHYK